MRYIHARDKWVRMEGPFQGAELIAAHRAGLSDAQLVGTPRRPRLRPIGRCGVHYVELIEGPRAWRARPSVLMPAWRAPIIGDGPRPAQFRDGVAIFMND